MTWIPLLLADPSPNLRLMVLKELLGKKDDDPEVRELFKLRNSDYLIKDLINSQDKDGSWKMSDIKGTTHSNKVLTTSFALMRFGYLGFGSEHPVVEKGANYLFSKQLKNGVWPKPTYRGNDGNEDEQYSNIPLQAALPLLALGSCGYALNSNTEKGYKWLLEQRLDDGAWPVGIKAGRPGFIAGYRRLAHSKWGCRTNTTAALRCLSLHPELKNKSETKKGLDILLGRETKERNPLGFEVTRMIGMEKFSGYFTFHARFDVVSVLNLCWRIGASKNDDRVADLISFILKHQGKYGLWEYISYPEATRWITFDILRSLSHLDNKTE